MQSATMELKSVVLALSFFLRFVTNKLITRYINKLSICYVRFSVIDQATSFARVEEDFQTEVSNI